MAVSQHHAVSAQCPACGLHALVGVHLRQDVQGNWVQVDNPRWIRRHAVQWSDREVQLDACPVCLGAWFDAGELGVLAHGEGDVEAELGDPSGIADRPCPHGHGPMLEHSLPTLLPTVVDRCATCHGVWLDGHERRRLARSSTLEGQGSTAERWLRRGAIWAAQVLTQLPVEVDNPIRGTPWVVYTILAVLLAVFVGQSQALIWTDYYGLIPGRLWHEHDLSTLVTYMFLHGSVFHLLGNGYFLYVFGDNVEYLFGRLRFAAFFVVAGVLAGLLHALVMRKTAGLVVGASGAISAVLAAYVWAFPRQRLFQVVLFVQLKIPVWVYVLGWFAFQVGMATLVSGPHASEVAWFAHAGGFLVGLSITPIVLGLRRREVARSVAVPWTSAHRTRVGPPDARRP